MTCEHAHVHVYAKRVSHLLH